MAATHKLGWHAWNEFEKRLQAVVDVYCLGGVEPKGLMACPKIWHMMAHDSLSLSN